MTTSVTFWWTLTSVSMVLLTPTLGGLLDLGAEVFGGNEATISRFSQEAAWAHPPYRWAVAYLLAAFVGHVFNTYPDPPFLSRWVTLPVFVGVPYLVVLVTALMRLSVIEYVPGGHAMARHPHLSTVGFMLVGYAVGAVLLHQTS